MAASTLKTDGFNHYVPQTVLLISVPLGTKGTVIILPLDDKVWSTYAASTWSAIQSNNLHVWTHLIMQVTNPCYRHLPLSEVCVRESLLCSKIFTALAQISGSAQAWTSLTFPLQFFHWQNFVAGCNPQTLKTSPLRSKTSEKFFEDPSMYLNKFAGKRLHTVPD